VDEHGRPTAHRGALCKFWRDPKFGIRAISAAELITFDVELEQIVEAHECRAHPWWKNESVGPRDTRTYVSERRRDALLVQNVAGGDDVLLDLVYVHWLLFPYFSPAQMSNSAKQCERIDHIDYGAYFSIAFDETAAKNRRASKNP
jgi:hypothetical protein